MDQLGTRWDRVGISWERCCQTNPTNHSNQIQMFGVDWKRQRFESWLRRAQNCGSKQTVSCLFRIHEVEKIQSMAERALYQAGQGLSTSQFLRFQMTFCWQHSNRVRMWPLTASKRRILFCWRKRSPPFSHQPLPAIASKNGCANFKKLGRSRKRRSATCCSSMAFFWNTNVCRRWSLYLGPIGYNCCSCICKQFTESAESAAIFYPASIGSLGKDSMPPSWRLNAPNPRGSTELPALLVQFETLPLPCRATIDLGPRAELCSGKRLDCLMTFILVQGFQK